jgi:MarR family transcriptional regulator, organic hydroperoxide resistance regulator
MSRGRAAAAERERVVDEVRCAFGEVLGAERRLRGRDQHRERKLSHAQVRALFVLGGQDEVTAGQLAKAAELTPASVTAMLDHLEDQGIVERRRSVEDRRVVVVSLTAQGRELLAEKRARWRQLLDETLAGLSDEELAAGARVMHRLAGVLDAL